MDKVQILAPVNFTERTSAKGNKYSAADVQGILTRADGTVSVFALLLMAPRGEKGTNLAPGVYSPVTELRVNTQDRMRLTYEIVGFKPAVAVAAPIKAAA